MSYSNLLLTEKQAADRARLSSRTLARYRVDGDGPPYCRIGPRCIRYRIEDIDAWVASRVFPHRAAELAGAPSPAQS